MAVHLAAAQRVFGQKKSDITRVGEIVTRLLCSPAQDVDRWSFDVFALNSASSDHALQTLVFELITRYGLNSRFKVFIFGSRRT